MAEQAVTATLIKELRDRTGVGMGKCKEALEEAKGDMDVAIANLRKAGIAGAVKKEGRTANEGMIGFAEAGSTIAIVEVNAETDFVVKNDQFQQFLKAIAEEIAKTKPASLESFLQQKYSKDSSLTIDQFRATIIQKIGENIVIRRFKLLNKGSDKSFGLYSHLGGKLLTMVELQGSATEEGLAKDIAMHVAAASPEFLSPEKVPAPIIEHEKEIARGQVKGKPANIMDKIVEGKLSAYYDQACLSRQKYIRNDTLSITDLINQKGKEKGVTLHLVDFLRWMVGQ